MIGYLKDEIHFRGKKGDVHVLASKIFHHWSAILASRQLAKFSLTKKKKKPNSDGRVKV